MSRSSGYLTPMKKACVAASEPNPDIPSAVTSSLLSVGPAARTTAAASRPFLYLHEAITIPWKRSGSKSLSKAPFGSAGSSCFC